MLGFFEIRPFAVRKTGTYLPLTYIMVNSGRIVPWQERNDKLMMQESVIRIGSVVDKLIARSDELDRPLSVPLRQLILLCSQNPHDNLTVGCWRTFREKHPINGIILA